LKRKKEKLNRTTSTYIFPIPHRHSHIRRQRRI